MAAVCYILDFKQPMSIQPRNTVTNLKELRSLTGDDAGAQRVAWTDTWLKARAWFTEKLAGLPVTREQDEAGNVWVTLKGESEQAVLLGKSFAHPRTAAGSHD